jgi:uncharacterized coiled-coil DUF342 family protein
MAPKAEPKADAKAKAKAKREDAPRGDDHIPRPDREAMQGKLDAITADIEKLQAKKKALDEKIKGRSSGKDEFMSQKNELASKIQQFKEKINALHEQKDALQKGRQAEREEKSKMAQDVKKMKASIGFGSEEAIDNRIREIEYRLHTDTLTLKVEKDLLKEISELKRNRPKVSQVNKLEESLGSFGTGGGEKETLQTISEQIRTWLQEKAKVVEELQKLQDAHKDKVGDLSGDIDTRNELGKQITEKIQERNKVRDDFRAEEKEFQEKLREKRAQQQERIAAEREQRQKEWEERTRQKKAEKMDEQPYVMEITLIEQSMKFCKSLTAGKEEKVVEEKKEFDHGNLDGLQVLGKKDERDEFFFEPTKGKKKSKAKGKEASSSKPIKHNAETFKLFDQLKLDAPITLDDIPSTIEKLEVLLADFEQKVKDWEKNKDERKAKILAGEEDEEQKKEEAKQEEKKEEEE